MGVGVYFLLTRGVSKLPNTVRHRTRTTYHATDTSSLDTAHRQAVTFSPTGAVPGGLGGAGRLELELDAQHAVAVRL